MDKSDLCLIGLLVVASPRMSDFWSIVIALVLLGGAIYWAFARNK